MTLRAVLTLLLMALSLSVLAQEQQEPTPAEPVNTEQPAPEEPAAEAVDDIGSLPVPDFVQERRTEQEMDRGSMYLKSFGYLLLVLGLILGLAYAAKKLLPNQLGAVAQGNDLKLVQTLPLGPRRYLALVEASGKRLLVGVTEQQINLVKDLDEMRFAETLGDIEKPKTVAELWEEQS